jgi:ABC-type multidrug transport system fused ATPase/permease subunit
MNKLKKYQKQIVTFITIFLLVTYGIFPALTAANTILNILGFVGALLLLMWAGLELKEYVTSTEGGLVDTEELKEAAKMSAKPKTKRKPKSIVKIDFTDAKGMNEIDRVITPIVEGRVKVSVETPKVKRKPKTK